MPSLPRVSIGLPVFNSIPNYFERSLDSLLRQSFGDFEIVLSDNGSNDECREIYERAASRDERIRYHRHTINQGPIANFNFVVHRARGDYFIWAADDDLRESDYLARTVSMLDNDRNSVTAATGASFIDNAGVVTGVAHFSPAAEDLLPQRRVVSIAAGQGFLDIYGLHRKEVLLKTGLMERRIAPEFVLMSKLLVLGRVIRTPAQSFFYRQQAAHTLNHYAEFLSTGAGKPMRAVGWHRQVALDMLRGVWEVEAPRDVRIACEKSLAMTLIRGGSFTVDAVIAARSRVEEALVQKRWVKAAIQGAWYAALSPRSITHSGAWRRITGLISRDQRPPLS